MGAFGEHLGLPWGTLESAIMELFPGLVPGKSQGGFGVHFGMLLEVILDGFLRFSESILGVILEPAV